MRRFGITVLILLLVLVIGVIPTCDTMIQANETNLRTLNTAK